MALKTVTESLLTNNNIIQYYVQICLYGNLITLGPNFVLPLSYTKTFTNIDICWKRNLTFSTLNISLLLIKHDYETKHWEFNY